MPLIKHLKSTDRNTAARRSNGRKSRGATTTEGKERIRAANLKHGYYSKLRAEALVSLGEDPREFAALIAGAHEQFEPANAFQVDLVNQLAGLRWRMRRAERVQESATVRKIQALEAKRRSTALQVRYRFVDIINFLDSLRQGLGRPDFFAHPGLIQDCAKTLRLAPTPRLRVILEALCRLRQPQGFSQELPPPHPDAMSDSDWEATNELYEERDKSSPPHPEIAPLEGEEREPLRCDLWQLLNCEIEETRATWDKAIAEAEAPLSILERDRLALEVQNDVAVMRREESTCFREFWRLGTILGKMQEGRSQESKAGRREPEGRRQESEVGMAESEIQSSSEVVSPMSEPASSDSLSPSNFGPQASDSALPPSGLESWSADAPIPTPDSSLPTPSPKNEGDSGDVDENKGTENQVLGKSGSVSASQHRMDSPNVDEQTREVAT